MRHPRPSTYGSVRVRCVTTQGGVVTRSGGRSWRWCSRRCCSRSPSPSRSPCPSSSTSHAGCPIASSAARPRSSCGYSPSRRRSRPRGRSPAATSAGPRTATTAAPPRRPTSSRPSPPRSSRRSRRRTDGRTPATRCARSARGPTCGWRPPAARSTRRPPRGAPSRSRCPSRTRPWCSRCQPVRSARPAPGRRCSGSSRRQALRWSARTRAPPSAARHGAALRPRHRLPRRGAIRRGRAVPGRRPRRVADRWRRRAALPPARRGHRRRGRRRRDRAGRRALQPGRGARHDLRSDPGPPGAGPAARGRLPGRHRRPGPAGRPAALDRSGIGAGAGRGGVRALAAQRRRPQCRRGDRTATRRGAPDARGAAHRRLRRRPLPGADRRAAGDRGRAAQRRCWPARRRVAAAWTSTTST